MNAISAQMLQDSLQNLGNTYQRSRQQDIEAEYRNAQLKNESNRTAVDQSFRDAQMQHYNVMEEKAADAAEANSRRADSQDRRVEAIEKKYGLQQGFQDLQTAQNNIVKGMQGFSLDKSLSPDVKTSYLKHSIDQMPDNIKSSVLQNPQIQALYDGKGDWDAVANAIQSQTKGKLGATDLQIKDWQTAQAAADASEDPDDKAKLQSVADMYKSNLPSSLKTTAPAVALKPTQTKTTQYNPMGRPTNTVTSFAAPGSAPGSVTPEDINKQIQWAINPPATPPQLAPSTGNTALNANGQATGRTTGRAPTRAQAAAYVKQYGQSGAIKALQQDGFTLGNGYAD